MPTSTVRSRSSARIAVDLAQRPLVVAGVGELQPHDLAPQARLELVGAALGDDPAVVEQRDPVRQLVRLGQVLGGEQDRDALVGQLPDRPPELLPAARVEPGGRLVEEEQRGPRDHADREVEAPAHAARVGLHPPVAGVLEAELGQQRGAAVGRLARRQVQQPGHHPQVLVAGQDVVDGGVLAGQADRAADRRPGRRAGRGRPPRRCPRPGGSGWRGCGPGWSCRPRSGRAGRRSIRSRPRGRPRRGRPWPFAAAEGLADPLGLNCVCHTLNVYCIHSLGKRWRRSTVRAYGSVRPLDGDQARRSRQRRRKRSCRPARPAVGAARAGKRGPRPGLSADAIVDAAIRLADAEGLEGVSMARVAAELGFTTMSLYRYVASKEELLQLMWNGSASGAEGLVLEGDGWRAGSGCGRSCSATCSTGTRGSPRCRWPRRRWRRTR